jgi:tripartite-type tricarboxylate transporter receptor subunit TctC
MNRFCTFIATAASAALLAAGLPAGDANAEPTRVDAQDKFPSRPVKIIVSLPAGAGPDIRARIIAEHLTKTWGRQVVVENRPGAGGLTGVQALLSAPSDGHTLLVAPASTFTILPAQKSKMPMDVNQDLVPIGLMGNEGLLVAVSPKLGIGTLAELIALAKKEPGKIIIGTNPAGTLPHMAARLLVDLSKAPMTVLPYATGGTNEAFRDILGGRIHAIVDGRPGLKGALASNDLKALAVMSDERHLNAPDLPTASETVPGLTAMGWQALVAPKGTPEPILRQLADDLRETLQAPDVRTRLGHTGTPFRPMFLAELAKFIEAEQRLWWPIVTQSALK